MNLFYWPIILWIKTLNELHFGKQKFYIFYVPAQRILPFSPESPECRPIQGISSWPLHCGAIQCDTVSYSATQCHPVENSAIQCHTVSHSATHCHIVKHSTDVPGGNKAPIKFISKLSKIIRICWSVVIMPHIYPQNWVLGIFHP